VLSYIRLLFLLIHTIICSVLALTFTLIDRSHSLYFILTKIFGFGVLTLSGIRVKVTGRENLNRNTAYVFASNHLSLFDIPVLQYWVPNNFGFIFKKELAKIPVFGWQLYLGPHIIIDRRNPEKAMKSIQEAKKRLTQKGISILLFPEGTRSKTGEIQSFKRGAFHLAAKVGFAVVPVTIEGTRPLMSKNPFRINPGTVTLHFDKPIQPENLNSRKDELELMEKVRDIIIKNYESVK
jgi:1-acyl-sn-glycerol-3-phosphate acyltransferase